MTGITSLIGSSGTDYVELTGATGETITVSGVETLVGGNGGDSFNYGSGFTAATYLNGNFGTDTLTLSGDYSTGVTLTNLVGVENITLSGTTNAYSLVTADTNVASGSIMKIDGSATSGSVTVKGLDETNGSFSLVGGSGSDTLMGGLGSDSLTGNGGADVFAFRLGNGSTVNSTSDSTALDRITDMVFGTDKFLLLDSPSTSSSLSPVSLASITYAYNAGTLSTGTLAGDIASIFADRDGAGAGSTVMQANNFIFFTSSSDSHTYLAVESGLTSGYQSSQDIFVDVTGITGLSTGSLTVTDVVSNT